MNKCFIAGSCVNSKPHVNSIRLHEHTTPCLFVWRTKKWEGNSRAAVINSSLSDGEAAGQITNRSELVCVEVGGICAYLRVFQATRGFSGLTCIMQSVQPRLPAPFLFIFVRARDSSPSSFVASRSIKPLPGNERRSPGRPKARSTKGKQ